MDVSGTKQLKNLRGFRRCDSNPSAVFIESIEWLDVIAIITTHNLAKNDIIWILHKQFNHWVSRQRFRHIMLRWLVTLEKHITFVWFLNPILEFLCYIHASLAVLSTSSGIINHTILMSFLVERNQLTDISIGTDDDYVVVWIILHHYFLDHRHNIIRFRAVDFCDIHSVLWQNRLQIIRAFIYVLPIDVWVFCSSVFVILINILTPYVLRISSDDDIVWTEHIYNWTYINCEFIGEWLQILHLFVGTCSISKQLMHIQTSEHQITPIYN